MNWDNIFKLLMGEEEDIMLALEILKINNITRDSMFVECQKRLGQRDTCSYTFSLSGEIFFSKIQTHCYYKVANNLYIYFSRGEFVLRDEYDIYSKNKIIDV